MLMEYAKYADLAFSLSLIALLLAIVSLISGFAHNQSMRAPAVFTLSAGLLFGFAQSVKPGGYNIAEAPSILFSTLSGIAG